MQCSSVKFPICEPGTWVPASNGAFPAGALPVGIDRECIVYLIRSVLHSEKHPGKLENGIAYVAYGGEEFKLNDYEVFCGGDGNYGWELFKGGRFPPYAVKAGTTLKSEPMYICRSTLDNNYSAGKIVNRACHIGFLAKEHLFTEYEVLVELVK